MDIKGICTICGNICIKCITCKLCGAVVCIDHQQSGVCINCLKGRYIKGIK